MTSTTNIPISSPLFDMTSIHQMYWKDFCDVCFFHLNIVYKNDEEMSDEEKYEVFRRKMKYYSHSMEYNELLLSPLKISDKRLENIRNLFDAVRGAECMDLLLSSLLHLQRALESLARDTDSDFVLISYMQPRECDMELDELDSDCSILHCNDKAKMKELHGINADIIKHLEHSYKNESWERIFYEIVEYVDENDAPIYGKPEDAYVVRCVFEIWKYFARWYNMLIDLLDSSYFDGENENTLSSFVYRLFMTYESSLDDISNYINENATWTLLHDLKEHREELIGAFKQTKLGLHWMKNMARPDNLKYMAHFLMNKRETISEEDEWQFFRTLDEICIISDILKGNAEHYGFEVEYPKDWLKQQGVDTPAASNHFAFKYSVTMPHTAAAGKLSDDELRQKIDSVRHMIKYGRDWFPILCVLMQRHYLADGDFTQGVNLLDRLYGGDVYKKPDPHDLKSKLYMKPYDRGLDEWESNEKTKQKYLSIARAFDELFDS